MPVFLIKGILIVLVLYWCGTQFFETRRIGIDTQKSPCIPGTRIYLIDLIDKRLIKGNIYQFKSKDLQPIYEKGTKLVKYLRGEPGDTVKIDQYGMQFINNKSLGLGGLAYGEKNLGIDINNFIGEKVLSDEEYWFVGSTHRSFDSRYWGTVKHEDIIGRAHPVF